MLDRAQLDNELNGAHQANFVRYAIYYTPLPGSPLAAFGRSWFGRANDGATLQAFSDAGLTGATAAKPLARSSRYSGLHAVFKAPFCLRDGMGPDALKARLISFAARRKRVETGPLTLARAGRYLVLRPIQPTPALDWLAAQCVAAFDSFAEPAACATAPSRRDPQRPSASLAEELRRSACVERVPVLHHAHRTARSRTPRAHLAGALADAGGDLRLGRDRRRSFAVRRDRRAGPLAAHRPLPPGRLRNPRFPAWWSRFCSAHGTKF